MILDIFRYIYYRMAHAYMNFGWSKSFSYHCSNSNVGVCISANIMSVALIIAYLMVGNLPRNQVYYIAIAIILITGIPMSKIFNMRDDDKFYDKLNLKYKGKKHRVIKGSLVSASSLRSLQRRYLLALFNGLRRSQVERRENVKYRSPFYL